MIKDRVASTAFASSATTVITKSLLHPLDTIKCRFQVLALRSVHSSPSSTYHSSLLGGSLPTWRRVGRQFKGQWRVGDLYGGLPAKLLFVVPYQTLYITSYDTSQLLLRKQREQRQEFNAQACIPSASSPAALDTIGAALVAETVSCTVRIPMEASKAWVQSSAATNSLEAFRQLTQGRLSFLLGRLVLPQTLLHDMPYSVVQWLTYEKLRPWARAYEGERSGFALFLRTVLAGGGAGLVASVATIPLDHIRTRALVLEGQRRGEAQKLLCSVKPWSLWRDIVAPVYREGGVRGFYRGGTWRVLWVTSNMALYFPVFELLRRVS